MLPQVLGWLAVRLSFETVVDALHLQCLIASAAAADTYGVAIDVPLSLMPWSPVPLPVENTVAPTAVTSGLTLPASPMPRDENDAIVS